MTLMSGDRTSYLTGCGPLDTEREAAVLAASADCVFVGGSPEGFRLTLQACGIGKGDAVLCAALGSAVIPVSIVETGAEPVFVDINPNTLNLDPYCLDYAIRKRARDKASVPKALIASDLFGMPCAFRDILPVCAEHDIVLIEDMGGAFGAQDGPIRAGSAGRFTVTSLCELEPAVGRKGDCAVLCGSKADGSALRALRDGADEHPGYGGGTRNAEEVQGILLCETLRRAEKDFTQRRQIAEWYTERLRAHVRIQESVKRDVLSAYTQFVIVLDGPEKRLAAVNALTEEHIPHTVYYPVALSARAETRRAVLVNAERAGDRLLALPMHPYLNEHVVAHICDCVIGALE